MRLPAPRRDVIYRAVNGGAVLLATRQEVYFGLNEVGSYIWEHLPPVLQTLDELIAALHRLHPDVPVHTLRSDVRQLLDDLTAHELVSTPAETDDVTHADSQMRQPAPQGLG